jgi:hypothetical protein
MQSEEDGGDTGTENISPSPVTSQWILIPKPLILIFSASGISHILFLCGRKDSMRVRTALCKVLGYGSFEALTAAGRDHIPPEGGAA